MSLYLVSISPPHAPPFGAHAFYSHFPYLNFQASSAHLCAYFRYLTLPVKFCTVLSPCHFNRIRQGLLTSFIFHKESDLLVINAHLQVHVAELGQELLFTTHVMSVISFHCVLQTLCYLMGELQDILLMHLPIGECIYLFVGLFNTNYIICYMTIW